MNANDDPEPSAGPPCPPPSILIEDDVEAPLSAAPSSPPPSTTTTEPAGPRKGIGENQAAVSGILSACRSAASAGRKRPAPPRPGDAGSDRARPAPAAEPSSAKAKRRARGSARDASDPTTTTTGDPEANTGVVVVSPSSRPASHAPGDRSDEEPRGEKRRRISLRPVPPKADEKGAAGDEGERESAGEGRRGGDKEAEEEEEPDEGEGTGGGKEATAVVTMKVMMPPHDPEDIDASIACAFEAIFAGVRSLLEETQLVPRINARNEEHRRSIETIDRLVSGIPARRGGEGHATAEPAAPDPSPASSPSSHAPYSSSSSSNAADADAREDFRDRISRYQRMRDELDRLGRTMLQDAQRERAEHKKAVSLHARRVRALRALDLLCAASADGTKEDRRCLVCMDNLGRGEVVLLRCAHALCLSCRINLRAEWERTTEDEASGPFSRCPHCLTVVEYVGPPADPPRRRPGASGTPGASPSNPEATRRHSGGPFHPLAAVPPSRARAERPWGRDHPLPNPSSGIVLLQGPQASAPSPSSSVAVVPAASTPSYENVASAGSRSRSATPTLLPTMPHASVSSALPSPASALPNATPDFSYEDYLWDDPEDPLLP